jgi:hypothetical protein
MRTVIAGRPVSVPSREELDAKYRRAEGNAESAPSCRTRRIRRLSLVALVAIVVACLVASLR